MNEQTKPEPTKGRTPPAPAQIFNPVILVNDHGQEGALALIDAHLQEWRGRRSAAMINHRAVSQLMGKDKAGELEKGYKEACTAIANLEAARAEIEACEP